MHHQEVKHFDARWNTKWDKSVPSSKLDGLISIALKLIQVPRNTDTLRKQQGNICKFSQRNWGGLLWKGDVANSPAEELLNQHTQYGKQAGEIGNHSVTKKLHTLLEVRAHLSRADWDKPFSQITNRLECYLGKMLPMSFSIQLQIILEHLWPSLSFLLLFLPAGLFT